MPLYWNNQCSAHTRIQYHASPQWLHENALSIRTQLVISNGIAARAIAGFHIGSACAHTPLCTYPCSFAISTLLWLCAQCAFSLHSLACAHLERIRSCQRGHVKHAIGKLCIMNLVGNKKYNNLANALDKQCIYDITQVPALLVLILESTFHMQNI